MPVYLNEVGYITDKTKHASVINSKSVSLYDINDNLIKTYPVNDYKYEELSAEETAILDFSDITTDGTYYFKDDNNIKSAVFSISNNPYDKLAAAALKMFYFQRCGCVLEEKYAGVYKHNYCHTTPVRHIRKTELFECNGGWHDAGDFGRYTTAGAVALGHLLYAYIINPDAFTDTINIPESGNGIPDILNECRYELEWMLKMQIADGSVYHKCTSMKHADFSMPEHDYLPFIVTDVSSLATADFAAICALASRVYAKYDKEFSDKLAAAAIKAGEWLEANPKFLFDNPDDCLTGDYSDLCDIDERLWAQVELYKLKADESYIRNIELYLDMNINLTSLGWKDVAGFIALSILTDKNVFSEDIYNHLKCAILDEADRLVNISNNNTYEVAMHSHNFKWGSNMILLTNAMVLCVADYLTDSDKYQATLLYQLDYLLGRNAMNTSYVTGFGDNAYRNPHNRPTACDKIDDPIPGYVSGGPNKNHCDEDSLKRIKPGTAPMKCYLDHVGSYSTNEITIYWNSPLVYVLAYIKKITK